MRGHAVFLHARRTKSPAVLLAAFLFVGGGMLPKCATAGPLPPANDSCANATLIASTPFDDAIVTSGATGEATDPIPECGEGNSAKSVWYRFTAPRAGMIVVDTFDSGYDTILSAYTGTCDALAPLPDGCSDDDPLDGAQSRLSFPAEEGTTYHFMISAFDGAGGDLTWRLRFFVVTPRPTGDANCDGRTTAADLPALITLIATDRRAACLRDDANGDGTLSADDLLALVGAIFGTF